MAEKSVDQKPSETALMAALHRAIAHKDYRSDRFGSDYLAEYFLPANYRFLIKFRMVRTNVKGKLQHAFPGLHEYMIARTAFFDRLFSEALEEEVPQILVLGAGYDSRAFRFSNVNVATKIIELDSGPTQERKLQCLRRAHLHIPEQLTLIPINFNVESVMDVLESAGYENDVETLFLWEGVCYYLEADAVAQTLELIGQSSSGKSSMAFDYTIKASQTNIHQYGVKEFYQSMKEHHQDERLLFSIEERKMGSYLEQRGLELITHLDNAAIERQFLVDEKGSLIGRIPANFRYVLASPKG